MNKLTQCDLCVLYLAERGGWVRVVEMRGVPFGKLYLGSESDRRLMEVMDDVRERGYYEIGKRRYVVEECRDGKFKTYRIARSYPKPVWEYQPVVENGRVVSVRPVLRELTV